MNQLAKAWAWVCAGFLGATFCSTAFYWLLRTAIDEQAAAKGGFWYALAAFGLGVAAFFLFRAIAIRQNPGDSDERVMPWVVGLAAASGVAFVVVAVLFQ